MSDHLVKATLDRIQEKWESKWTLILVLFVVSTALIWGFSQFRLEDVSLLEWAITVIALAMIVGMWFVTNRMPKHKAQKVGFGVAISCGDEEQWRVLKEDLIDTLRRLLAQGPNGERFDLIVHNHRISAETNDNNSAVDLLKRSNASFLIYGSAKLRQLNGKEHHVLRLDGVVAHDRVPGNISKAFASEFGEVLPRDIRLPKDEGMVPLELTAELVDVCSRYIIGTAAMISGDYDYALSLFEELVVKIQNNSFQSAIQIQKIRSRIPERIAAVHQQKVNVLAEFYRLKRDKAYLVKIEEELRVLGELTPQWYKGHLLRAICAFVLRRDTGAAWREVKSCERVPDTTWRFTEAFLHAYDGKLNLAWRSYQVGFENAPADPTVPIQCEEFINIVLNEEPEKTHLYYCLGLINWKAKGDLESAAADFRKFLECTSEKKYPRQHKLAKRWIDSNFQHE